MKVEFSKLVLGVVMVTYFVGVTIGGLVVWRDHTQLQWYLSYIGAATTGVIGFYSWKAKAENVIKLGKDPLRGDNSEHY